ncbi:PP2C family protein-serine/threonine phosphatase [Granulicella rosea]|uniref:PP2C family protein-serine/threonine phosphatase n=1 Tax=Granulicella rosea TaxID=474952 RepID=UPI00115D2110|nr:PP2C family serine/threonine-protein phosphatase [Granulicella rosea]
MNLKSPPAAAPAAGCTCGASADEADEDGFCLRCGRRVVRPASDHVEEALSPVFAAVSDRGIRHDRNEDRFGMLQSGAWRVMAVCDGVSATRKSEIASAAVSEGLVRSLGDAVKGGVADPELAMRQAIAAGAANLATRTPRDERENPPSTTVVAALVRTSETGLEVAIGWIGDSRAYWIDASGATPLTVDHSWLNEVVASGEMSAAAAAAAPQAHAITRWIGADAEPNLKADIVRRSFTGAGTLLLCTDGLWNYASAENALAKLVHEGAATGEDALATARRLVQFANERGGQDNITVALLHLSQPNPNKS